MAVTKLWPVNVRLGQVIDYAENPEKTANPQFDEARLQALGDVLAYAKDEEKTEQEFFVSGINCTPDTARDQFVTIKRQYGKEDGIQAYHGYLSFEGYEVTPAQAHQIGLEFAQKVWGKRFQVVVTTHLNTKNLHDHFVINSVSFMDGKRLANEEKAWFKLHHIADEICLAHGLKVIENPERNREPYYLTKKNQAGMPTTFNLVKQAIDEAISQSCSMPEFESALHKLGYTTNFNPRHQYWSVRSVGSKKSFRLYRLGEDYTNLRIRERVAETDSSVRYQRFQPEVKKRQYRLQTRGDKARKVGGLYGLYLYYCYRLGAFPSYQKQNPMRLHRLLRDDLMKLDKITAEVRLLGREHIQTAGQLFSYKASVESEIKTLTEDRTHLRNEARRKLSDDELSEVGEKISSTTGKIKELRKELVLCDGIAARSKVMEQTVAQLDAEEHTQQRKENRNHEQWR